MSWGAWGCVGGKGYPAAPPPAEDGVVVERYGDGAGAGMEPGLGERTSWYELVGWRGGGAGRPG